ncbi:MAG: hypothetical protein ACFFAG_11620 [Promethearchaeota archaeon]
MSFGSVNFYTLISPSKVMALPCLGNPPIVFFDAYCVRWQEAPFIKKISNLQLIGSL